MPSTYLHLTNRVIRKINEVELTESNFLSARGMQALCKDAVVDAINEINQQKWEWPFHAVQAQQALAIGESEYAWPIDIKSVDWNSFQIIADETIGNKNSHLKYVDRDEWYNLQKDMDEDNFTNGSRMPTNVFKAHGNGFGITPNPDKTYTVEYRYYKQPISLINFDDQTDIPVEYDNIITFGALYHMNLFRENQGGYAIAEQKFKEGIKNMYNILVNNSPDYAFDTRVNFGGQSSTYSGAYHL